MNITDAEAAQHTFPAAVSVGQHLPSGESANIACRLTAVTSLDLAPVANGGPLFAKPLGRDVARRAQLSFDLPAQSAQAIVAAYSFNTFPVAQMHDHDIELRRGQRIRLSALGKERCKLKTDTGVVAGRTNHGNAVRVLMDGRKQPQTLHRTYIEAE